jgi:hypothetical protein
LLRHAASRRDRQRAACKKNPAQQEKPPSSADAPPLIRFDLYYRSSRAPLAAASRRGPAHNTRRLPGGGQLEQTDPVRKIPDIRKPGKVDTAHVFGIVPYRSQRESPILKIDPAAVQVVLYLGRPILQLLVNQIVSRIQPKARPQFIRRSINREQSAQSSTA